VNTVPGPRCASERIGVKLIGVEMVNHLCDFLSFPANLLRFRAGSCIFLRFKNIFLLFLAISCNFLRFLAISCDFLRFLAISEQIFAMLYDFRSQKLVWELVP
jgi:hypothetical protein